MFRSPLRRRRRARKTRRYTTTWRVHNGNLTRPRHLQFVVGDNHVAIEILYPLRDSAAIVWANDGRRRCTAPRSKLVVGLRLWCHLAMRGRPTDGQNGYWRSRSAKSCVSTIRDPFLYMIDVPVARRSSGSSSSRGSGGARSLRAKTTVSAETRERGRIDHCYRAAARLNACVIRRLDVRIRR